MAAITTRLDFERAGKRIAVEVHGAALVGGSENHLHDRAGNTERLVLDDHSHSVHPAGPQPGQVVPPALRRLREALGNAGGLAVAVIVDIDGGHDGDVLVVPPQLRFRYLPST